MSGAAPGDRFVELAHRRQDMRDMAALVPRAEFVELADAAHIGNMEQPERFDEAVLRFLQA